MPELIEVEFSRRLAEGLASRTIDSVDLIDPHASELEGQRFEAALLGEAVSAARRRGKLLLLDTAGATLGMHFGMTGRLVVDGRPALERLLYSPESYDARWLRFRIGLKDGGSLELYDARRLARVSLDPFEDALGPDAASVSLADLRSALGGRTRGIALKARLLDQSRLAGVGNLIADEVLWRVGLSPERPAASLDETELRALHRRLRSTIAVLLRRGGSHTGDLMAARVRGGRCPKDGSPLSRVRVGRRTTFWCPAHQH